MAAASLLLMFATLAWYARVAVLDADGFADRAGASVRDASVRTLIADRLTDQVVLRHKADLVAARPIISSAIAEVVGGQAIGSLFRRAVLDVHRAVFARDENTVTLTLADVGTVAAAALQTLDPTLAAKVDASGRITLLHRRIGSAAGDVARAADRVRALAYVLAALAVAAAATALALAVDRRRTAARLGLGAVVAGIAIVLAHTLARAVVLSRVSGTEERAAAAGVWDAWLGDLRTWGLLLAGSGAVVAAAASSLIRPVAIEGPLRAAARMATTEPTRPAARLLRALALIAVGLLAIAQTPVALQVAATLAGVYLLFAGVMALLRLVAPPQAEAAGAVRRPPVRALAVPVVVVAIVLAGDAAFLVAGGASAAAPSVPACNGAAALCDRALDEVTLPATHNSMSAPLKGWFSSQQDRGIAGQLEDGIRGLMIDTHYADKLADDRVRTYFASAADLSAAVKHDGLSRTSYEAALRLRERAGFRGTGTRGIYLCHTFCELGSTPLADGLKDVHEFLVTHPAQVVIVINEDYVTPSDFVTAVDDAGLTPYVFTPPSVGSSWPTLRQMIDDDRRLVILAEDHAGGASWYQLAYRRLLEETPYSFRSAAQLADDASSCRANRGPAGAPLFLVNNWITTDPVPQPSNAATVNAYATLLARARACSRLRHHVPNLLAVDFYKRGAVFRVVDTLNGV